MEHAPDLTSTCAIKMPEELDSKRFCQSFNASGFFYAVATDKQTDRQIIEV